MKRKLLLLSAASFCVLLSQTPVFADVITAFSVTPDDETPFTIDLNSTFSSTLAKISNSSVACDAMTPCSGEVATYSLTVSDITGDANLEGTMDGTLTGPAGAVGAISLFVDGVFFKVIPFTIAPGAFSKDLFSTKIPNNFGDPIILTGGLNLTLAPGDSFNLPNSLEFAVGQAAVPEPAGLPLIGGAMLGLAALVRRLRRS